MDDDSDKFDTSERPLPTFEALVLMVEQNRDDIRKLERAFDRHVWQSEQDIREMNAVLDALKRAMEAR